MPILRSLSSNFPTYIIPSIPFRRRSTTTTTTITTSAIATATASSASSSSSPPAPASSGSPPTYLSGHTSILRCSRCLAHLCTTAQIVSKGFTGRHGRAYLVSPHAVGAELPNSLVHKPVERNLVTGMHTVSDISCLLCGTIIGWKYVAAKEDAQMYKVGKFILEAKRVVREVAWEGEGAAGVDEGAAGVGGGSRRRDARHEGSPDDEPVEFDSQDEDECEDMFLGIWSEALAKRTRREKAERRTWQG
jgi:hypothetical protein